MACELGIGERERSVESIEWLEYAAYGGSGERRGGFGVRAVQDLGDGGRTGYVEA